LKPSARNKNTSNNKQIRTARPPSTTATAAVTRDPRIQARPPHESADTDSSSEPKFAFPDKEKEMELSKLQVHVNDLYKRGNYRVALTEAHALLEQSRNHFGEFHPATAAAHNNVGLCHKQLGQFDQARRAYQASMKVYKQTVGSDHHSYASALHNLGTLNRSQIHLDASLKATDRLTLMDESTRVLEQAYRIRRDELGEQHPHTVASRSSWGATLAARILHSYKQVGTGQYINTVNTNTTSAVESELAWAVCEEHLRQAMDTAIANPRGPSISKKKKTNKKATNNNNKQAGTAVTNEDGIQTLSAASAAQNLAIFLKTRATTESPYNTERLDEAHRLYTECLTVRSQLLYKDHPDVYTTKYSLAELLQVKGDEEAANAIRQEILDTYDPPTASGDGAGEEAAITAVSEDFDNVQATAEDAATK
jgi:tetratricopeptide (TPR) repeat protein